MPADASARLEAIGAACRRAGSGEIKNRMTRNIRVAAAPLVPAVKAAAARQLPKRGGLNELIASRRVTVSVLTSANRAGVRLKSTNARGNRQTDSGIVRHPDWPRGTGVLRSTWKWSTEEIPQAAGWWSKTLNSKGSTVASAAIVKVISDTTAEIEAL